MILYYGFLMVSQEKSGKKEFTGFLLLFHVSTVVLKYFSKKDLYIHIFMLIRSFVITVYKISVTKGVHTCGGQRTLSGVSFLLLLLGGLKGPNPGHQGCLLSHLTTPIFFKTIYLCAYMFVCMSVDSHVRVRG